MRRSHHYLDFRAMVILVVLCASWGLQQISIKVAIAGISPVLQAGIRSAGAAALVLCWMLARKEKVLAQDGTLRWGILIGTLFSIEFVFIYWGLEFTHASRSVIFMYTMPFFTAVGAHLFIAGEQLKAAQVAGLCCAFLGTLTAFSESLGLSDPRMLIGDSMLMFSALLWAAVTVIIKAGRLSQIRASKTLLYQLAVSALLLPACSLMMGEPGIIRITPLIAGCMIYQVVWVAFITYLAWFWLINNYPAARISAFLFLTPMFGVLEGAVLLEETLSRKLLIALAMVSVGIYLVNRRHAKMSVAVQPK